MNKKNWDKRFDSLPDSERCKVCGQPDNCGDCTHGRLSDEDAHYLVTGEYAD